MSHGIEAVGSEDADMNANLTRDVFIELLDFIDEPDDDTAGVWSGVDARQDWTCVCGKNHYFAADQRLSG
jgi:hypothetical protein